MPTECSLMPVRRSKGLVPHDHIRRCRDRVTRSGANVNRASVASFAGPRQGGPLLTSGQAGEISRRDETKRGNDHDERPAYREG